MIATEMMSYFNARLDKEGAAVRPVKVKKVKPKTKPDQG